MKECRMCKDNNKEQKRKREQTYEEKIIVYFQESKERYEISITIDRLFESVRH